MLTKEKIIESIKNLPDTFSTEDIIDRIILLEKIEKGLDDSKKGRITPEEQLDKKLSKWLE